MRLPRLLALATLAALAASLLACGGVAQARERTVLVLTETKGFRHDSIADGRRLLRELGRESAAFDVVVLTKSSQLTPKRLAAADALVLLNTSGKLPFGRSQAAALLDFVRDGGGLVGFHAASATEIANLPEFGRVLGGEFKKHPFIGVGRVVVEDRSHPATRALADSFQLREEYYFFKRNPRARVRVLARLDVASFGGDGAEDRPLVWCRREGNGRVFYDALGHFPEVWRDPNQRALVEGGLRWALKLEAKPTCR